MRCAARMQPLSLWLRPAPVLRTLYRHVDCQSVSHGSAALARPERRRGDPAAGMLVRVPLRAHLRLRLDTLYLAGDEHDVPVTRSTVSMS